MKQTRAQIQLLPDRRRLHLHDGPIDIVLEAFGDANQVQSAYCAASDRFVTVLDELCEELPRLRSQVRSRRDEPEGVIARRMFGAVLPYAEEHFITSMAAVAGAVAEEILLAMTANARVDRAYVNNGGDIALHIGPSQSFTAGMIDHPDQPSLLGTVRLDDKQPSRGIATSGCKGRSFSLGIADAVTVVALTASIADAAATIIANAVDIPGSARISRRPACELAPDSDLRSQLVTTGVAELTPEEKECALSRGAACARVLRSRGLIHAAALSLQGMHCLIPDAANQDKSAFNKGDLVYA